MIRKIVWPDIVELLSVAKSRVVLIMPAIHEEWLEALKMNPSVDMLQIYACVDNSETVIRNGYGSFKAIDGLIALQATVTECPGLRISFISADNQSYFLFIESRIIAGNPDGLNAVIVQPQAAAEFVNMFFNLPDSATKHVSQPLVKERFNAVKEGIVKNPPEEPDLKRRINTYSTLFQYMELHFEGANLQSATITIPPKALPFKDEELKKRMKTKFNLFTKEQTDTWGTLLDIKQNVEALRKKYLTPCKLKKSRSIIKKDRRKDFFAEFDSLKKDADDMIKKIIDDVQAAILDSKLVLKKELTIFFKNNPPEGIMATTKDEIKNRMIEDHVDFILSKAKIPSAHELINKMNLEKQDAEFTTEDLHNEDFLDWFKEKGLVSDSDENVIAKFDKAFQIKR